MIKCLLLKTGITVVSEMLEVGAEVGEPDCHLFNPKKEFAIPKDWISRDESSLVNPCEITENGQLRRWPSCTDQRSLMIGSDNFLTIVDPSEQVMKHYKEVIG